MRPTILVGFAEALPAPEVLFSLKRAGFSLCAFLRAGRRAPILSVLDVPGHELTPPELDFAAAVQDLRQAAAAVDGLFALDDAALKLCAEAFGPGEGPVPIHATGPRAEIALDKIRQIDAARKAGLAVPETLVVHRLEDIKGDVPLPAIVKPALAAQVENRKLVKGGTHYLFNDEAVSRLAAAGDLELPVLIQPLIRGAGEGVFGFAGPQGVVQWSGHERVRMMNPHGSGASACRIKMPGSRTREQVETMMQAVDWRGPFMIELLRDEAGRAWFMELNGRMWGSMALARRNGLEYPAWAAEAAFDPDFRPQRHDAAEVAEMRHLGRDILHLLFLARGPKTDFHRRGWPRLQRSLAGVLRPHAARKFYNYDPDHPGFFLRDAWETIASATWRRR